MSENDAASPYAMLRNFYFPSCRLMWAKHRELWSQGPANGTQWELVTFNVYWFASLYVVLEGWRDLKLHDPEIDLLISEHVDSLRLFRNGAFHFQPKDAKFKQWMEVDKWNWGERLMVALKRYFDENVEWVPG